MDYRLGNSKRIKSQGDTGLIKCPDCKNSVQFGVFSNFEARLSAETLIDTQNVYFLVCPECASVFTVKEEIGKSFSKGQTFEIVSDDLKALKEFK